MKIYQKLIQILNNKYNIYILITLIVLNYKYQNSFIVGTSVIYILLLLFFQKIKNKNKTDFLLIIGSIMYWFELIKYYYKHKPNDFLFIFYVLIGVYIIKNILNISKTSFIKEKNTQK